ncbi:MAG: hypothetical protein JNL98_02515 [Bryobacterales bacterium]|nr:hypothetical protein [Bryobacterales bacterium]
MIKVLSDGPIPAGEYGFFELYCDEAGCDCRRVIICVLRPETGWNKVWATIGYGWEKPEYYRRWAGPEADPFEMKGPSLDELNEQSQYAPALLEFFRSMTESQDYVARLKRHYEMFRDSVERGGHSSESGHNRMVNRRKRLRDPRRRGTGRR